MEKQVQDELEVDTGDDETWVATHTDREPPSSGAIEDMPDIDMEDAPGDTMDIDDDGDLADWEMPGDDDDTSRPQMYSLSLLAFLLTALEMLQLFEHEHTIYILLMTSTGDVHDFGCSAMMLEGWYYQSVVSWKTSPQITLIRRSLWRLGLITKDKV